jgi:Fe-S cluster assembly protein SufD
MIGTTNEKDIHLAHFAALEAGLDGRKAPWVHALRRAAIERFTQLGFPSVDDEEWRNTNVAPIAKTPYRLAPADAGAALTPATLEALGVADLAPNRIVFANGRHVPGLSTLGALPRGVRAGSLAAAIESDRARIEPHLARHARFEGSAFAALNTAFLADGAFVDVPKGVAVAEPIHLVFVAAPSSGRVATAPMVSHPRTLVLADAGSQVALVETYVTLGEGAHFTNAVTEIVAEADAVVDHYRLQRESLEASHVSTTHTRLDRASTVSSLSIALGGALVRNDAQAVLGAEGGEATLNGLYLGTGSQLIDNHTTIDHAMPHCASHELYKGILTDAARGVFNGKILVRKDAQKTDAKQTNKNLLLSPDATINTKPQLEIYADDVKCTHGATIGRLDEEALFYLRSRGIDAARARNLLTYAFASDILRRIKVEALRTRLEGWIFEQLHTANPVKDPT